MNNNRWGKESTSQSHYHYSFWEDYRNGLLDKRCSDEGIEKAKRVLSNKKVFLSGGKKMITRWPQCTGQFMTDKSINRRAYIGATVCNFLKQSTQREVKIAWWELTEKQRLDANIVADKILEEFECLRRI